MLKFLTYLFPCGKSLNENGPCVGIFSSWQSWLCVWVLCALPCAKNCVGSGGKVMGDCICEECRNRVTYNVSGIGAGAEFIACRARGQHDKERKFYLKRKASLRYSLRSPRAGVRERSHQNEAQ